MFWFPLQWRHNGRDSVSNHQPHDCLLNGLFKRRSKKTSKPRVTGLCVGNSPGTGEFPAQVPGEFPAQRTLTRKMFPFDDVIVDWGLSCAGQLRGLFLSLRIITITNYYYVEVEAINKALTYVKVSSRKSFVIFSDSMSVLQAIES